MCSAAQLLSALEYCGSRATPSKGTTAGCSEPSWPAQWVALPAWTPAAPTHPSAFHGPPPQLPPTGGVLDAFVGAAARFAMTGPGPTRLPASSEDATDLLELKEALSDASPTPSVVSAPCNPLYKVRGGIAAATFDDAVRAMMPKLTGAPVLPCHAPRRNSAGPGRRRARVGGQQQDALPSSQPRRRCSAARVSGLGLVRLAASLGLWLASPVTASPMRASAGTAQSASLHTAARSCGPCW